MVASPAEFENLAGPFEWIGEIEARVKGRLMEKLGREKVQSLLSSVRLPTTGNDVEMLTMGSLELLFQNRENWEGLDLPFERAAFCAELSKARELRNRLMHFRDPLNDEEKTKLKRFCDLVRRIRASITTVPEDSRPPG